MGGWIKIVQKGRAKRVYKNANLMLSHGRTVVIALADRTPCHDTASRIIRKLRVSEDRVLRGYLQSDRNYVNTLRFWD